MSADLLAAFGEPNDTVQQIRPSQRPCPENAGAERLLDVDTDTGGPWGSCLSTSREARILSRRDGEQVSRSHTPVPGLKSAQIEPFRSDNSLWRDEGGTDVLFDASTEDVASDDGTDDWGEFESAKPSLDNNNVDILDWDISNKNDSNAPFNIIKSTTTKFQQQTLVDRPADVKVHNQGAIDEAAASDMKSWDAEWTSFEPSVRNITVPSKSDPLDDDVDWGDFTDAAWPENTAATTSLEQSKSQTNLVEAIKPESKNPLSMQSPLSTVPIRATKSSGYQHRPMNIPPPSILLPLFPLLLEEYYQRTVKTKQLESQDSSLASSLENDLKVMARVLAGRTLRWKRDSVLSQSTKIGPARSGKVGGMKLTSVNKSENIKEEKEAVEVYAAWRKRSSHLNSVILAAGGRAVPMLPDNVQVRTGTMEEDGALKASHACGLCGLKRDERIPKIDGIVYDNFGEWWIELWGHTECRNFWEANCRRLAQR
ncbi:hypothetical protein PABG_02935 [Paracoccidioides brasiliensis Pb03]|nr:hypothetical protein PABG_02935 [Paracoccidioides brasiliensis Pb03]